MCNALCVMWCNVTCQLEQCPPRHYVHVTPATAQYAALLLCTAMHSHALAPQQPSTGTFFSIILIFRNIPANLNTFNRSRVQRLGVAFFILIVCTARAPPCVQCTSALYSGLQPELLRPDTAINFATSRVQWQWCWCWHCLPVTSHIRYVTFCTLDTVYCSV